MSLLNAKSHFYDKMPTKDGFKIIQMIDDFKNNVALWKKEKLLNKSPDDIEYYRALHNLTDILRGMINALQYYTHSFYKINNCIRILEQYLNILVCILNHKLNPESSTYESITNEIKKCIVKQDKIKTHKISMNYTILAEYQQQYYLFLWTFVVFRENIFELLSSLENILSKSSIKMIEAKPITTKFIEAIFRQFQINDYLFQHVCGYSM